MKTVRIPPPSDDKRWKIIDGRMRKLGYKPHGLIEVLHAVQESFGYLDRTALLWVARSLGIPPSKAYGVATFYNFFTLEPQGAHVCVVCLGTACYVKGAASIVAAIEKFTGIRAGETTPDGQLSLLTARCMGACGIAPAIVCDRNVHGRLTPGQAVEIVKECTSHAA
jgi:bidirectional [NiFe] hydrogenase diaphorase subunit